MPESVASIRETSTAKNNASGNVRSNNGGLYYTTSDTTTQDKQTKKSFNSVGGDGGSGFSTTPMNVNGSVTKARARASAHFTATADAGNDYFPDNVGGDARVYGGTYTILAGAPAFSGQGTPTGNSYNNSTSNTNDNPTEFRVDWEYATVTGSGWVYYKQYGTTTISVSTSFA